MNKQKFVKYPAIWFACIVVVGGLGVWGWLQRGELLAWHWARELSHAAPDECGRYVDRLAGLEADAVPALVERLRSADETSQSNCGWALAELARRWGIDSEASAQIAHELQANFANLNALGKREAFTVLHSLLRGTGDGGTPDWLKADLHRILPQACASHDDVFRAALLPLAAQFMHQVQPPQAEWMTELTRLVEAGLIDPQPECRAHAIRLAAAPQVGCLDRVAALLTGGREQAAEVRVVALLALGGQEALLATDDLLPYLHDTDAEVRRVCEQALRSRGLVPAHLQLARQMTDPRPTIRSQVPALVHEFPDLDTQLWLERLSRDQSPAVRAAVLRAAGDGKEWRLTDRMREMAGADPSPTVRQIARFYLQQQLRDEQ